MSKTLNTIGGIILVIFVAGVVNGLNKGVEPSITPQATATSGRNFFVSGCKPEAAKYPAINAETYCGCAYDKLLALHPDFNTNTELANRIISQGYNSQETDAMATCVTQPTVQVN